MNYNCCNRFKYDDRYDCNYVNRPFCDLRPISNCQPYLRTSCPDPWFNNSNYNSWNCESNGNNNFSDCNHWNEDSCNSNNNCYRPNNNCNNRCVNPNLIWFLGGLKCGSRNSNRY